jgi:hypothetical protein
MGDALGRFQKPLAIGVFSDRLEDLANLLFHRGSVEVRAFELLTEAGSVCGKVLKN